MKSIICLFKNYRLWPRMARLLTWLFIFAFICIGSLLFQAYLVTIICLLVEALIAQKIVDEIDSSDW